MGQVTVVCKNRSTEHATAASKRRRQHGQAVCDDGLFLRGGARENNSKGSDCTVRECGTCCASQNREKKL